MKLIATKLFPYAFVCLLTACTREDSSTNNTDNSVGVGGGDASGGQSGDGDASGGQPGDGDASGGQSGDGDVEAEPLACVQTISLGYEHSCATNNKGSVYCWGKNGSGQLGVGDESSRDEPTPVVGLPVPIDSLSAGYTQTYALASSGEGYRWGEFALRTTDEYELVPTEVDDLPPVAQLLKGGTHSCALLIDGGVSCWRANTNGQQGNGGTEYQTEPGPVSGLTNAVQLSLGYWHSCALRDNKTVVCWGGNDHGQVGDGTHDDAHLPLEVTSLGANVVQVAAARDWTCALLENGTVSCWGRVGYFDNEGTAEPYPIDGLDDVVQLAIGDWHACALKADKSLWCWYDSVAIGSPPVPSTTPAPIEELGNDVERVVAGFDGTCVIRTDGSLWCFGAGRFQSSPTQVALGCL